MPLNRKGIFISIMSHVPLKKHPQHFISSGGFVFRITRGKEEILHSWTTRTKRVMVTVEKRQYELLYLMMEAFEISFKPNDKIAFTVDKDGRINLGSIRVKQFLAKTDLPPDDERLMYKYKCDTKATSANQRCIKKITPAQVYYTLKIHEYKCVYCAKPLEYDNWHLDHFTPLSRQGKNVFENIVPSCPVCNTMKGALQGNQFYAHCRKIAQKCFFAGKDDISPVLSEETAKPDEQ